MSILSGSKEISAPSLAAQSPDDLAERPAQKKREHVRRITEIQTRFNCSSECDRQLLITAAGKVVAQNKEEITGFLAGFPMPDEPD